MANYAPDTRTGQSAAESPPLAPEGEVKCGASDRREAGGLEWIQNWRKRTGAPPSMEKDFNWEERLKKDPDMELDHNLELP